MEIRIKDNRFTVVGYFNRGKIVRYDDFIEVVFRGYDSVLVSNISDAFKEIVNHIINHGEVNKHHLSRRSPKKVNRAVLQFTRFSNEFIREFESPLEASIYLGNKNPEPIRRVCRGYTTIDGIKYKSAYGFRWKYKI